jgi:hypothetical protein
MVLWHDAWKPESYFARQRLANTRPMEMRIRGNGFCMERASHVNRINKQFPYIRASSKQFPGIGGSNKRFPWIRARLYKEPCREERFRITRVEAGSNTSTVILRVVGGDEKGSLESATVKYGRESHGTRTWEWLRWRGPAAIANDRPVLSSERQRHQQTRNCLTVIKKYGRKPQMGALF